MKSFKELQTEATKQTKKGVIAKAARKGTPPYTVVVLDRLNKVVKQETTQVADAVPAFVHELQKRYPKGDYKISVEDKGGSRVYSEEVEIEEGTSASQRGEPQTPHTQKQYDALSPKDKKLVDARVKAARKQSDSRNPSESPRNYKKRKPKTRRGGVSKYGRGQAGPLPKNEDVNEGTWELPDTPIQKKTLEKLMSKPLPVGSDLAKKYKNSAAAKLYSIIGDDELFDDLDDLRQKKGEKADARPVVKKAMNRLGIKEGIDEGLTSSNKDELAARDAYKSGKFDAKLKEYEKLMKKYGKASLSKVPPKDMMKISVLGAELRKARLIESQQIDEASPQARKERLAKIARAADAREKDQAKEKEKATAKHHKYSAKSRLGGKYLKKANKDQFGRTRKEDVDEGIVILPKRSSRGGDVKEVGKDKRGNKTQYWWKHKNGLKNVYDSLEKLRYALRNDANFKDAEEITKQLGEAVNEGGMGRMKDPHTIRYVDPKQKDTTNISVVDGEREAKKFLAKVKKKGMSGTIKKGSEQPGSIQTVKYNQSTDQLNKASRYDTLTGKRK